MSGVGKVLAISGGVGGAKLALGLSRVLPAEQLIVVANTADDFCHLGLSVSPDLDTVMYTLAGLNNTSQGWGLADESWRVMDALEKLGGETWFRLGDRDLATHLERTHRLQAGVSLSDITRDLCQCLGVQVNLLPMSDDPVMTVVKTTDGELPFQEYFVREQCRPTISGYRFDGIEIARPQPQFLHHLQDPDLVAIVICPSNPFVSVEPVLSLGGVREAIMNSCAPVVAVSPIVNGMAIKGPAAKMMDEMNVPRSPLGVAEFYGELLDGFVMDVVDEAQAESVRDLGIEVSCEATVMNTMQDRIGLARAVLKFAGAIPKPNNTETKQHRNETTPKQRC